MNKLRRLSIVQSGQYTYEPLDNSNFSIRLISLSPGADFSSAIHCSVYQVSLDSNPEYEAVSYAWGDPNIFETIFLDGFPFSVTVNLVSALRHLRLKDEARVLWVDALSIDQSNLKERGQQVSFMAKIYSMAKCDALWLGEDENGNDGERAFEIVAAIADIWDRFEDEYLLDPETIAPLVLPLLTTENCEALKSILSKPLVWRRIWIVQEIVRAKNVNLHFGQQEMSWGLVRKFHRLSWSFLGSRYEAIYNKMLNTAVPAFNINDLRESRDEHLGSDDANLAIILWQVYLKSREATDPRDMIFAFLGLINPQVLQISPDYTKSAEEIFISFTRKAILNSGNLDSLCFGHITGASLAYQKYFEGTPIVLPSWTIDFRGHSGAQTFASFFTHGIRSEQIFSASGPTAVSLELEHDDPTLGPDALVLSGIWIDKVVTAFEPIGGDWEWKEFREMIREIPSEILTEEYCTGEPGRPAVVRTLLADQEWEIRRLSVDRLEKYCVMFEWFMSDEGGDSKVVNTDHDGRAGITDDEEQRERALFHDDLVNSEDYRFCLTERGFMALIPDTALEGDILCILYGSNYPHTLRPVLENENTYQVIGNAYVHGFMDGEVLEWRDKGKLEEKKFILV
jgi:hypothetical protein